MAGAPFNDATDTDLRALSHSFNDTAAAYPAAQTIHGLFEQQAARSADQIAAVHQHQCISYAQLNRAANQLARRLRDHGVGPTTIVALMVDRSIAMFIGILGILKAGAAYLPIDPAFPEARIEYMLHDAGAALMLTQHAVVNKVPFVGTVLCLDDAALYQGDDSNLDPLAGARDLIYVIYTSGSTGQPKGVMIEHQSVHNFIIGVTRQIDFAPNKSIVCLTTISFDIFVLESLLPLTQGLRVVIANPMQFARDMAGQPIDMLQTTPSTMRMLLQDAACVPYLRGCSEIMLGGEPFPKRLLHELRAQTRARIYNMYGPTETTVWSTIQEATAADELTIGRPIANTYISIVDEQHRPLAPGSIGELCIAGDGVARGYLNRPELTAERFVPNPFADFGLGIGDFGLGDQTIQNPKSKIQNGARFYRTGDLAAWLPNGEIAFFGRRDSQVKIRGFRIELGEVEDRLSAYPDIRACAVVAQVNAREEAYLVAYYTADRELTPSELIAFLGQQLPDYMIPGFYLRLERLPYTPNAKLDRQALPKPDTCRPHLATRYAAPETDLERQLAHIWRTVLQRDSVGIHDNFFELGGNSILVSHMFIEIEQIQPNRLSIADVFAYPTIARLAALLQSPAPPAGRGSMVQPLRFPDRFYSAHGLGDGEVALKSRVAGDVRLRLDQLAHSLQASLPAILLAAYTHLLSELTQSRWLELLAIVDPTTYAPALRVDLDSVATLAELIGDVQRAIEHQPHPTIYTRHTIDTLGIADTKDVILTYAYDRHSIYHKPAPHELACIITDDRAELLLQLLFDRSQLVSSCLEALLTSYIKLLKALAKDRG